MSLVELYSWPCVNVGTVPSIPFRWFFLQLQQALTRAQGGPLQISTTRCLRGFLVFSILPYKLSYLVLSGLLAPYLQLRESTLPCLGFLSLGCGQKTLPRQPQGSPLLFHVSLGSLITQLSDVQCLKDCYFIYFVHILVVSSESVNMVLDYSILFQTIISFSILESILVYGLRGISISIFFLLHPNYSPQHQLLNIFFPDFLLF